jgi:hypothetical protein
MSDVSSGKQASTPFAFEAKTTYLVTLRVPLVCECLLVQRQSFLYECAEVSFLLV